MKKKTISYWKKKAWHYFSEYIRLRDCLQTTGTLEWGKCVTCSSKLRFTQLQAGHLLDGHIGLNYLDERGVFAQCMPCNVWKHGNKEVFIPWFLDTYGDILFKELQRLKRTPCRWKQAEYEKFIEETKKKIDYIKKL